MNIQSASRSLAMASVALTSVAAAHAQSEAGFGDSGWFLRADASARFNVKASISRTRPLLSPGTYDNGFVLPDIGGTASGKTWNWGYNTLDQNVGGQLVLSRLDGVPGLAGQDLNVNSPLLGGELIGGYNFSPFQIGHRNARFAFEIGYGYSGFSENINLAESGTAALRTDSFGLGGIIPPLPPYAGTATGPGPLIDLNPSSQNVTVSPVTTAFRGSLETTFHDFRIGPAFSMDLTRRLTAAIGAGYSSVYIGSRVSYVESVNFSNPAMPAISPGSTDFSKGSWYPGVYAEGRLHYRITDFLDVFVGGDIRHNGKLKFGDAAREVTIDITTTYAAKAGLTFQF
jgi:hypothetical protein